MGRKNFGKRLGVVVLAIMLVFVALCGYGCSNDKNAASINGDGYYREELSEGVKNVLLRARQMYEVEWTPLVDIPMYSTLENVPKVFKAGQTYRGVPYGQPVHQGVYVGYGSSLEEFVAESQNADSKFYTERGLNTYYADTQGDPVQHAPYYSSDCSAFVSYCWDLSGRTTTAMFADDPERFPVVGDTVQELKPGLAINSAYNHIILIYDVVYDKDGKVVSVTTIEQTPPIMTMKSFGLGGTAGSLDDLQAKLDDNYDIISYVGIEDVKYTASEAVLVAEKDYVSGIELPVSHSAVNAAAVGKTEVSDELSSFEVKGWALSKEPISGFTYTVNGGEEKKLSATRNNDYCGADTVYYDFAGVGGVNAYTGKIALDFEGTAEVAVWATTASGKISVAEFSVTKAPEKELFKAMLMEVPADFYTDENGEYRMTIEAGGEDAMIVPFSGWFVCEGDVKRFEVSIDGGQWKAVPTSLRGDVYDVQRWDFPDCRDNNAFSGEVDLSNYSRFSSHTVTLRAVTADNAVYNIVFFEIERANGLLFLALAGAAALVLVAVVVVVIVVLAKKKSRKNNAAEAVADESAEIAESADAEVE